MSSKLVECKWVECKIEHDNQAGVVYDCMVNFDHVSSVRKEGNVTKIRTHNGLFTVLQPSYDELKRKLARISNA